MILVRSAFAHRLLVFLLGLALLPLGPVAATQAATTPTTWKVTTISDTKTPSAAHCTGSSCPTLRDALFAAHSGDSINLAGLSGSISASNVLTITTSLTITGPTTNTLTVQGTQLFPVFWLVGNQLAASISNLTISRGGCCLKAAGGGSGIAITASMTRTAALTLTNTVVTNNPGLGAPTTSGIGGGIYFDAHQGGRGTLTLINSSVANNVSGIGGGINFDAHQGGWGTLTLINSSIISNTATYDAGIHFTAANAGHATLTLTGSYVQNNLGTSGDGGIMVNAASGGHAAVTLDGSTVSNNKGHTVGEGLDMSNDTTGAASTLTLNNSTLNSGAFTADDPTSPVAVWNNAYNLSLTGNFTWTQHGSAVNDASVLDVLNG